MLPNWIVRNKYKLIAFSIGLYVLGDGLMHKGLVRVMIPKNFPEYTIDTAISANKNVLVNAGKEWIKGVNTKEIMNSIDKNCPGLEIDVYFDTSNDHFDVHHDKSNSIGLYLDSLLAVYAARKLKASIWLDLKNLTAVNNVAAVKELLQLQNKYGLANKILVESQWPQYLTVFSDNQFSTSYYTPSFNPYLMSNNQLKFWVDSLSTVIKRSNINFLSGYYFQYPFLQHYFPRYPVLIWSPNDKFSIINWWYKRNILANKAVFITLYP